jgi:LuxR family maltose regulon positive regulatory protein
MPVLGTKLHVPAPRRALVARDRLVERLHAGPPPRLLLVAAPAGFGKTTVLSQWLGAADRTADRPDAPRVAWLSLDAGDDDPRRFLTHLVAAVRVAAPEAGAQAAALLDAGTTLPVDEVLVSLVNDLARLGGPTVLALDDYHLVRDPTVHAAVAALLDALPPQVTIAIATRADPPLPLARLRARGELHEVRAADLRFTADEADAFLNGAMGLGLEPAHVAAFEERTEGWAAGLQLAGLSVQGRTARPDADLGAFVAAFSGSHRFVLDYLLEEVLAAQPDETRAFLLDTSVLDQLTGPLCDALTGRSDGAAVLDAIERADLFLVPLDDERRWYRYHHLFADALRSRLAAADPERAQALRRRAAGWYAAQGLLADAVHHALAGGDPDQAADLVELELPGLSRRREDRALRERVLAVPPEVARARPLLAAATAWSMLSAGDLGGVEPWLDAAEAGLASGADRRPLGVAAPADALRARDDELRALPAMTAVYRASVAQARGDLAGTVAHATRALGLADPDDHLARGAAAGFLGLAAWADGDLVTAVDTFGQAVRSLRAAGKVTDALGAVVVLGDMWVARGRPDTARRLLEDALATAQAVPGPALTTTGDLHVALADVLREADELDAAQAHLDAAEELGERASLPENRYRWFVVAAGVRRARGDLAGAAALLEDAEPLVRPGFFPAVRPVTAARARVRLAQGRTADAREWARTCGITPDAPATFLGADEQLTLARLALAEHREGGARDAATLNATLAMLDRLVAAARTDGRDGGLVESLLVRALSRDACGERAAATADLAEALGLGVPAGYRRLFLDEGAPLTPLLEALAADGAAGPAAHHARALLVAEPDAPGLPASPATPGLPDPVATPTLPTSATPAPPPSEPLSPRESEVLRLLATDLTGPEIARHLYVSVNTLRTHTKHVFTKLGVGTRRAAVRRAADLGLL